MQGRIPPSIGRELRNAGIVYRSRDTSKMWTLGIISTYFSIVIVGLEVEICTQLLALLCCFQRTISISGTNTAFSVRYLYLLWIRNNIWQQCLVNVHSGHMWLKRHYLYREGVTMLNNFLCGTLLNKLQHLGYACYLYHECLMSSHCPSWNKQTSCSEYRINHPSQK